MVDRTVKILLATIALGVWGLLLRPVFTMTTAHAAPVSQAAPSEPQVVTADGILYVVRDKQVDAYTVTYSNRAAPDTFKHVGSETLP